jgi:hypothetical protein
MPEIIGPQGAIGFTRDALGYPTIAARDLAEGTYALGYLHAQDRLVQITLTGLAARGELMSVLGDVPLARLVDHSTRALGLGRATTRRRSCAATTKAARSCMLTPRASTPVRAPAAGPGCCACSAFRRANSALKMCSRSTASSLISA